MLKLTSLLHNLLLLCAISWVFSSCSSPTVNNAALKNSVHATVPSKDEDEDSEEVSDKDAILTVVNDLFDGMREGDSAKVKAVFHPEVTMQTTFKDKDGKMVLREEVVEDFIIAVGTPRKKIWLEKIYDVRVEIDANLAQAWVPYKFYLGDEFSHCGVNAIQLVKNDDDNSWKIIRVFDTRRKTGCVDLQRE